MGRELKRKQAKREGKNVREVQKQNADKPMEMKTFVTIIVALLLCFVILYILTGLFVTKDIKWFGLNKNTSNNTEEEILNEILASETLRQTEEVYYVYYYNASDEDSLVSRIVDEISDKVYRVDLEEGFNTNYVGDPSGIVENISDLKVEDPTIIKIESGKMTGLYSGKEEIKAAFEEE